MNKNNVMEQLPAFEAQSFASWVAHTVEKYFEDPEVKKRFEAWKKEREALGIFGD